MKKLLGILFLLVISVSALAQSGLSPRDQQRFDSYFARWQEYRRANDHGQIVSMERRMLDLYSHYGIPAETPFWRVATNGHDEARREEQQEERPHWRERLSDEDRGRFDRLYTRWREAREHHDSDDVERLQHRMWEIMERNQIPREVRFEEVASRGERY